VTPGVFHIKRTGMFGVPLGVKECFRISQCTSLKRPTAGDLAVPFTVKPRVLTIWPQATTSISEN